MKERDLTGRTDFRDRNVVTIDGEHARDFDDAISIERLPNGHYWLGVHIADVAHYVPRAARSTRDAYERGTSVYFPERAVHMFPEELATGLCSLKPHVDRLVQSCVMEVDGARRRGPLRDARRRDPQQRAHDLHGVNAILTDRDADDDRASIAPLVPMFELMRELFEILQRPPHAARLGRFRPARSRGHSRRGGPHRGHRRPERNVAHRLIEEFMLLANETVARPPRVATACRRSTASMSRPTRSRCCSSRSSSARSGIHSGAGDRLRQADALPEARATRFAAHRKSGRLRS